MRNSLSEQPKAQKHEYVVKAPVTPAVPLLCAQGNEREIEQDTMWDAHLSSEKIIATVKS